jgi:hypothetical protein
MITPLGCVVPQCAASLGGLERIPNHLLLAFVGPRALLRHQLVLLIPAGLVHLGHGLALGRVLVGHLIRPSRAF